MRALLFQCLNSLLLLYRLRELTLRFTSGTRPKSSPWLVIGIEKFLQDKDSLAKATAAMGALCLLDVFIMGNDAGKPEKLPNLGGRGEEKQKTL